LKPLAYIGHSFHQKTGSTQFFIELLREVYEVDIFWCDSWRTNKYIDLEKIGLAGYDKILFFQVLYPPEMLKKDQDKCIILPMYDGAKKKERDRFWLRYKPFKFINFSWVIHSRLSRLGVDSLYIQYFPAGACVTVN